MGDFLGRERLMFFLLKLLLRFLRELILLVVMFSLMLISPSMEIFFMRFLFLLTMMFMLLWLRLLLWLTWIFRFGLLLEFGFTTFVFCGFEFGDLFGISLFGILSEDLFLGLFRFMCEDMLFNFIFFLKNINLFFLYI